MSKIMIREADKADKCEIVKLSKLWEDKKITYGLVADSLEQLDSYRAWVTIDEDTVVGYIMGNTSTDKLPIFPIGEHFFEIEELYVIPQLRSEGVGGFLFEHLEPLLKKEGISNILLSTATKDYKKKQLIFI